MLFLFSRRGTDDGRFFYGNASFQDAIADPYPPHGSFLSSTSMELLQYRPYSGF